MESHKYNKKSINRLQIDNQILTDLKDIDKAPSDYYKQLYMPDAKVEPDKIDTSILPKLTEERKAFLEQDMEMEELAWALETCQMAKYVG